MAQPLLSDFDEMTRLWAAVSQRSTARAEAEALVFNQMVLALATRLSPGPDPALCELHALARGIAGRGFLPEGPEAPITGHAPHDRIRLSAESFRRLQAACQRAL